MKIKLTQLEQEDVLLRLRVAQDEMLAREFKKIRASMSQDCKPRKLTDLQLYVLNMVNPEWPTTSPDYPSKRILWALEARKLVRENYGRWYITSAGIAAASEGAE